MKTNNLFATVLLPLGLCCSGPVVRAGSFSTDFDSGQPAGTAIYGNALISPNDGTGGGFNNSGCLQLTPELASQSGSLIITNDLDNGTPIVSFTASFKVLMGSAFAGADGMSFNFATDLPADVITEEGAGTGLTVEFDTFPNSGDGPRIDVKVGGSEIATNFFPALRTSAFVDVVIQLNPNGTLDVVYDGVYAYSNLNVSGFVPAAGSLFGVGARTGSSFDLHYLDNLTITTRTQASPFVQSFAPRGRRAAANSAVDLVLTDSTTHANTNKISLMLDGSTVSPAITQDGSGNTYVHFAPASPFSPLTTRAVNLIYADDAGTPHTNSFQYNFTVGPQFVLLFSEDFEHRNRGALDMNLGGGPNAAANGDLTANPWFGPAPPNSQVVGTEGGVLPHSGTNMIRGSAPTDLDENWYNLTYRLNGQANYLGNIMLDWYFYDPLGPTNGSNYREFMALGFYNTAPNDTDYPGTGSLNSSSQIQRLCLGAGSDRSTGSPNGDYDSAKYQVRVVGAVGGYSTNSTTSGWFNTSRSRTNGWHHGRTVIGPVGLENTADVDFYLDDILNPLFTINCQTPYGFNVIEINVAYGPTFGYVDDIGFYVARPPNLSVARDGNNAILSWPGTGFTLQSSFVVTGMYTDVIGVTSPYTNDVTANPTQFFRLRN